MDFVLGVTGSNAQDGGTRVGWAIENARRFNSVTSSSGASFQISVNGTAIPTPMPSNSGLVHADLQIGDTFRLLFLSSTTRDATASGISNYNTHVKDAAAAGHTAIQPYSAGFRVVGCTSNHDAPVNTRTRYTTSDTGVPIYWLNGAKAADDYADFYDGSWDEEAADKNESGTDGPDTSQQGNYPWTGCDHDGTRYVSGGSEADYLGDTVVRVGRPNASGSANSPLNSSGTFFSSQTRPMYGLSELFAVAAAVVTNSAPTFPSSTAARSVAENTAAGQGVGGVLTATDDDSDPLTYTLEGADAASFDIVTISDVGGHIRTKTGVTYNHEAKSTYTVVVKADDTKGGTATVTVTISVTDVTEPPAQPLAPSVSPTAGSTTSLDVSWTAPANTGPPIDNYDLQYQKTTESTWTNGPQNQTGTSAAIGSLDAGTAYRVQVRATNAEGDSAWSLSGSGQTNTASNTAPTFPSSTATRSVAENSPAGTDVGNAITATDADNDTLTYTLEGADSASFDLVTISGSAQIRTKSGVTYDHETKSSYAVTVKADDGNGGTDTIAVTITVTDVNEPPDRPAAPSVSSVANSTTSLEVTWTAPATTGPDIDNYDLRYREGTSGNFTNGPQNVNGTSATIMGLTANTLYQVQVLATNNEGDSPWSLSGSGQTNTAGNTAPTFPSSTATRSVAENSPAGTDVGNAITATDDDGDTLTYTLEGTDAASFNLVTITGSAQIRTRSGVTYDREAQPSYAVIVKVDDGNGGTDTVTVTINLTDVDEPPRAPAAPTVRATPNTTDSLTVSWRAPSNTGRPAIDDYDLQYREGNSGGWTNGPQNVSGTSATIAGLTAAPTAYQVQVRATNDEGDGPWSPQGRITPPKPTGGDDDDDDDDTRTTVPDAPRKLLGNGGDGQVTLSWDAPEDGGGLAITDYEYQIDGAGEWISIGSAQTTHTITGLTNGTVYVFQVRAVNRIGRSGASNRAEVTPGAVLDFAHFANGADIISSLVLMNVATHPIRPALYFYDKRGNLIDPELVVDLTEDLEVTGDGSLSVQTEMEPLGELTISTHGREELVSGSVRVVSGGPIGGVLSFDLPGIGVAGVGSSLPLTDALFPARRRAGGIATAAAIRNLGTEAMGVSCQLMKDGAVLEETEIPLEANGQEALYIEEMFTGTDTSDFLGSVRCTAPGREGMFTGVAVELDAENRIFTTLPVVPVDRSLGGGRKTVLDFAHFANGAGITSELVFVNRSTQPSRPAPTHLHSDILPNLPVLYFYDQSGGLIDPGSVVDVTGDLVIMEDGALSVHTEMEPLGVLTILTHGRGELVSGSVKVTSDRPLGGFLRFGLPGIGVAGVGVSRPVRDAIFPARRQAGGISSAAAIHNLEAETMVVTCRLMKDGAVLEEVEIHLEANGQEALYIEQMFTNADTSDFVGSVRCTAPGEGMFTGVAVELDAGNRIFTTLPVVPVPERMSQE